jgi:hypothetical protein
MHPEISQVRALASLSLSDLIRMVDHDMIFTAGMDVKVSAQVFGRYSRTFDLQAWKTCSPGTIPFHLPLGTWGAEFP